MSGKGDLEAGRIRKFFWGIFIFKASSLRLGHLVCLTARTLQSQETVHKARRKQFGEVSWRLHSDSFTLTPLTEKT
jgi:hypothetical protein